MNCCASLSLEVLNRPCKVPEEDRFLMISYSRQQIEAVIKLYAPERNTPLSKSDFAKALERSEPGYILTQCHRNLVTGDCHVIFEKC